MAASTLTEAADAQIERGHRLSRDARHSEAEACYRQALALVPDHALALNNLGWERQMQGDVDEAVADYERALRAAPGLRIARRNLAVLYVRLGLREKSLPLWRQELASGPQGVAWLAHLAATSMQARDLTLAGEYAALLAQARWGSDIDLSGNGRSSAMRLPAAKAPQFLSVPKLRHDIEQFIYLQRAGIFGDGLTPIIAAYEHTLERLLLQGKQVREPLDEAARRSIGHVFNRLVHVRPTPRLTRCLSGTWSAQEVEEHYLDHATGLVVIDDFLAPEALESLRLFCLESTVWSGNRYAHGRLGAFFRDGFNCPLLLQIAEELRGCFPRMIGDRHPLRQMWGFKNGEYLPGNSTTHADFAAVNVNFWITPDTANLDATGGGLVVYGVDAPAHWDFDSYNSRPDRIHPYLRQQQASAVSIPYRANRAVIFNSDLFHGTAELHFRPGYENRRINITMLYGDRADDVPHKGLARPDMACASGEPSCAWRSAAFRRAGRST